MDYIAAVPLVTLTQLVVDSRLATTVTTYQSHGNHVTTSRHTPPNHVRPSQNVALVRNKLSITDTRYFETVCNQYASCT